MHPIFRRFLSSTVKELGADLPTSEIFGKKSLFKFFKLEEIYDFEHVVQAPEGSVVGINQVGPTSHKKGMHLVDSIKKPIYYLIYYIFVLNKLWQLWSSLFIRILNYSVQMPSCSRMLGFSKQM